MFSRIVSQTVKRVASLQPVNRVQCTRTSFAAFSTAEVVPGIGRGKTSTGIVGLPADLDAVSKIITSYQALLDRMAASDLPENAQYRVDVENISNYRIKIATENPDDPELVEELCQCGQVEELVQQAELEMGVLEMYLKERLWEHIDYEVDVDIEHNPDPSKDGEGLDDDA
mmetsp:Transcript_20796/g.45260  ORF Transcript_20796/g.45260 Transcript_20796/m.45260 type:complete len:171 (-) Transcript_20796:428-940(-)|eukprot:CAMPEP_0168163212 /NCGR_PEP_ID=MMETSP0139_2-20121125/251_1 /TAXON_ID=44445 /ORGANISM="Pseudo-nitzschia australis, Strain 10249 10 AB" /LENGTH=170 /DNA_ID=CAMNT_0008080083 /DNA_START=135 /DNA_END=647 /DNA_ORIENTATION=-